MIGQFKFDEGEEAMAAVPIYLSSNESENSTPCSSSDYYLASSYYDFFDAINQLIGSQPPQLSTPDSITIYCSAFPTTCSLSDGAEQKSFTHLKGNPMQDVNHVTKVRLHPIQMCQCLSAIRKTPESTTQEI